MLSSADSVRFSLLKFDYDVTDRGVPVPEYERIVADVAHRYAVLSKGSQPRVELLLMLLVAGGVIEFLTRSGEVLIVESKRSGEEEGIKLRQSSAFRVVEWLAECEAAQAQLFGEIQGSVDRRCDGSATERGEVCCDHKSSFPPELGEDSAVRLAEMLFVSFDLLSTFSSLLADLQLFGGFGAGRLELLTQLQQATGTVVSAVARIAAEHYLGQGMETTVLKRLKVD